MVRKITSIALPAFAFVLAGCYCLAPQQELLSAWSEDDALKMDLAVLALPRGGLGKLKLKLTVTNTSANALVLDREMAAGFSLRFRTDLSEESIRSDDKDVSWTEVKRLIKPKEAAALHRFVTLKPGESLSRTYDLAKPIRVVTEGHYSGLNMVHYGFYYEAVGRFRVPAAARKLFVDAWYERGVWMMAAPQFKEWFGRDVGEIGLWGGRAHSRTVVVEKPPR